ncbi:DNA-directed RNA polymerase subunit delta [Paenibacillus sp. CC-CFT747]|nr:DNA-directed RNA polymerase subunit delta [Paenibacillus sp. CC-CFT747]
MSNQYTLSVPADKAKEMAMVDLAFMVLKAANTPFYYRDLMNEIAKIKGFDEEKMMDVIAQLYTEINVDGRFACVGNNLWGLKRWYPVDNKSDDAVATGKRPRIINDDDDDLDEEDYQEEEETYTAEEEDFDAFNEDSEEVAEEEEEEEFFEEEIEDEEADDSDIDEVDEEAEDEEDSDLDDEEDADGK